MKKLILISLSIAAAFVLIRCTKEAASSAAINTGAGGSTARFTISGNYLYVVDNYSLKAFDISNPAAAPVLKSKTTIGVNIETIFPYQDKLFIGSSQSMYIYSLANPASPQQIGTATYQVRMACDPVVAKDSTAYATLNGSGPCGGSMSALVVYDIKNITSPVLKTTIPVTSPYGLGVSDSALYVCDGPAGLRVYNVKNTYQPAQGSFITGRTFYDVIPYGNLLICQVSGGIVLYDITNRLQPVFRAELLN